MTKFGILTAIWALAATSTHADLAWPDPSIPVPDEVRRFIAAECTEFQGWSEETVEECISAEMYGYRAVVEMLMDEELGDRAVERYRGCAVGLGRQGGRFHRRKAECVSGVLRIHWRFEFAEETTLGKTRKANLLPPHKHQEKLAFAMSIIAGSHVTHP